MNRNIYTIKYNEVHKLYLAPNYRLIHVNRLPWPFKLKQSLPQMSGKFLVNYSSQFLWSTLRSTDFFKRTSSNNIIFFNSWFWIRQINSTGWLIDWIELYAVLAIFQSCNITGMFRWIFVQDDKLSISARCYSYEPKSLIKTSRDGMYWSTVCK